MTSFILAFFWYLKASRPQKVSVRCLCYAMRNLFICAIIHAKNNITSGKNNLFHIILYPGPDRRVLCNGLRESIKFRTLYPHWFFFFPSLTVGRDWNSLISGLLCPHLGMPTLTLSLSWEPRSLANAGLIP